MFHKTWLDLVKCDPRHLANTFCIASSPSKWDMRFFFRLDWCSQTVWPCEFVCMAAQIVWAASWQTTTAMDTGNLTIRQNVLAWYVSAKDPCANDHSNGCPIYSIPGRPPTFMVSKCMQWLPAGGTSVFSQALGTGPVEVFPQGRLLKWGMVILGPTDFYPSRPKRKVSCWLVYVSRS